MAHLDFVFGDGPDVSTYVRTLTCSIQNKNMNISQMEAAQWKFDKNLLKVKRQFSKSSIKKSKIRFHFFSFEKNSISIDVILQSWLTFRFNFYIYQDTSIRVIVFVHVHKV